MGRTAGVYVTRAFELDGRDVQPGDFVQVAPLEAAMLARKGYVTLTMRKRTAIVTKDLVAEPPTPEPEPPPVRPRRTYRRKDQVAEPAWTPSA